MKGKEGKRVEKKEQRGNEKGTVRIRGGGALQSLCGAVRCGPGG